MARDQGKLRLNKLDMGLNSLENKDAYEKRLAKLQRELLYIQQTYWHEKRRAIILFEGWDAAGKGGCIRRLTEQLDPRGYHVWPISAPSAEEQSKHYLYRFWTRLPSAGTFAIFDRSWYGRVLVERVEGFAKKAEWKRAYDEINEFERMLTDDGVRIIKIFLHISPDEQLNRFRERLSNPQKRWKLTEDDLRNRARWDDYVTAIESMFDKTSTEHAPWHLIPGDSKWVARIKVLELINATLSKGVTIQPPPLHAEVARSAAALLGVPLASIYERAP